VAASNQLEWNKYIGPLLSQAKMYTGRVTCCPLVSHGECADRTDGWMPDHYITFCTRFGRSDRHYLLAARKRT